MSYSASVPSMKPPPWKKTSKALGALFARGAIEARRDRAIIAGNGELIGDRHLRLFRQQGQALPLIGDTQIGRWQIGGQVSGAFDGDGDLGMNEA